MLYQPILQSYLQPVWLDEYGTNQQTVSSTHAGARVECFHKAQLLLTLGSSGLNLRVGWLALTGPPNLPAEHSYFAKLLE